MRPPDPPPLLPEVPGVAFRPVPGCPGVAAGSDGSVWRLDPLLALEPYPRPPRWRPAQVYARADGPAVVLPEGGRFVYRRVEDVVAAAFGRAADGKGVTIGDAPAGREDARPRTCAAEMVTHDTSHNRDGYD